MTAYPGTKIWPNTPRTVVYKESIREYEDIITPPSPGTDTEKSSMWATAVCVDLAKLERTKPKPQNQLLLFAKCEPKSCTLEYNYVVRLPVKEVYHIIIFMCILQGQRKPPYVAS